MKKVSTRMLKALKYMTEGEVERSTKRWPPPCAGITHQPKRPKPEAED